MTLRVSAAHFKRFVIMETVTTLALVAGAIDRFAGVPVFDDPMLGWFAIAGGLVLSAAAAGMLVSAKRDAQSRPDAAAGQHRTIHQPGADRHRR